MDASNAPPLLNVQQSSKQVNTNFANSGVNFTSPPAELLFENAKKHVDNDDIASAYKVLFNGLLIKVHNADQWHIWSNRLTKLDKYIKEKEGSITSIIMFTSYVYKSTLNSNYEWLITC